LIEFGPTNSKNLARLRWGYIKTREIGPTTHAHLVQASHGSPPVSEL
jgi:hypothetical protein